MSLRQSRHRRSSTCPSRGSYAAARRAGWVSAAVVSRRRSGSLCYRLLVRHYHRRRRDSSTHFPEEFLIHGVSFSPLNNCSCPRFSMEKSKLERRPSESARVVVGRSPQGKRFEGKRSTSCTGVGKGPMTHWTCHRRRHFRHGAEAIGVVLRQGRGGIGGAVGALRS